MMIVALFSWWYGVGWSRTAHRIGGSMQIMLETFSVALLLRTLFHPFRQISAEQVRGSFDTRMRAMGDLLFSRIFGAVVRSIFILFGLLAAGGAGLLGLIQLIVWPFVPFFPVIGILLLVLRVEL